MDTEFITGFKKPIKFLPTIGRFNKPEFFIQLISIGIVCEDGRELYAISNEFDEYLADDWVKENVISKLPSRNASFYDSPRQKEDARRWMSNIEIRNRIVDFMGGGSDDFTPRLFVKKGTEIYAYLADYDWIVFCNLFGRMIDLPYNMPMYCKDLKQYLDDTAATEADIDGTDFEKCLQAIKENPNYPKQENEHSALDDARWNFKLYQFLNK